MRQPAELLPTFHAAFGTAPTAVIRAPGRINLIGDHIDYLQLPVLPCALDRGITLLVRARPDAQIRLVNLEATFAPAELTADAAIPPQPGCWSNYVRAGVAAVLSGQDRAARGFDACVGSDLPVASGLSSSSALVVAAALAAQFANDLPLDRLALAETLAQGERYVGTEGGGMDQAVSLCAEPDRALRIDFAPLRVRPLPIPPDWRFLVTSSLRASHKSEAARAAYNERSRSARAALAEVAPGLTGDALLAALEHEPDRFRAAAAQQPRLRHVLGEAVRVQRATAALRQADAETFGRLMSESHTSLRDDYGVSTPELDEIVATALAAGALGARLTGAGFGGCAIALCPAARAPQVQAALTERFLAPRGADAAHSFVAVPSAGASVAPL